MSSSTSQTSRSFLYQWPQRAMPKQIPLRAPIICAVCGSPEIACVDRVYHRNMNFPRIEWASHLPVQVCARHQGTWKMRIWSAFLLSIAGLLGGIYLVYQNAVLGYSVISICVGITFFLVYWRDPAARAIRIESFGGFSLIQPRNTEWSRLFLQENGSDIREIPDVLGGFRRKRTMLFLICVAAIIGMSISLAIVIPLWPLISITSELVKHPEFLVGILVLTVAGIFLCIMLVIGLDRLMREKEKAFQGIQKTQPQPTRSSIKE